MKKSKMSEIKADYKLTPTDVNSISDVEMAFSTKRLLPLMADVPDEFFRGNIYTELVESIFYGRKLLDNKIEIKDGFSPTSLNRMVRSHLKSFDVNHEHKIAGVGFMISLVATVT